MLEILTSRLDILESLFAGYAGPPFAIHFWDGWRWLSGGRDPVCTVIVSSPQAMKSLIFRPSEVTLGEAFVNKEIDVEGDLFSVFAIAEHVFHQPRAQRQRVLEVLKGIFWALEERLIAGGLHSIARDSSAISFHYDQPVDFFRPWLGPTLAYSCAYFTTPFDSLDVAQRNKLEMICRKLRLKPLERFLDIGCGWGSLVMHAASEHRVFAHGITLSIEQERTATRRIEEAELTQSCQVALRDYRDNVSSLPFDKIASVGMFEHVGLRNLPRYFKTAFDLLKPGGTFLNHGIARAWSIREDNKTALGSAVVPFLRNIVGLRRPRNVSFIDKYVFPDGELVTLAQATRAAESVGFEVRDVENLREHYELTLRAWTTALQQHAKTVLHFVPEKTYRIWLLYMAGSAAAFRRGDLGLYQILLSKPLRGYSGLPLTRDDWYKTALDSE